MGGWLSPGVAVAIPPTRTLGFLSFMVHLPAQQKLVEHLLGTDSCGVLLVLFSLKRDALKACRHVADQVLSIVRINAQLKLVMRPTTVPLGR